jgi:hypothetical protein
MQPSLTCLRDLGPRLRERLAPNSEGAMRTARFTESRWWRSCARLIATGIGGGQAARSRRADALHVPFGGFQANDGRRLKSWEVEKKWLPSVRPAPLSFSNHRCSGIYDAPVIQRDAPVI